ncbi:MAG: hypothetical protein AAF320_01475 [Myxococcota bacterium]
MRFKTLQLFFVSTAAIFTIIALFSSPLLGTPTAEMATLLTVVWGPVWLMTSTVVGAQKNRRGFAEDLLVQTGWMAGVMALCITIVLINRLRFHSCSPTGGTWVLAVLTLPAWCLNTVLGLWIGRLASKVWCAVFAAICLLAAYTLWQVILWKSWPSFYVATHLSAVIAGDLMQGYQLQPAVIAYRCSTLLFALSFGLLGIWLFQPTGSSRFLAARKPPITTLSLSICLCCFAWIVHSKSLPYLTVTKKKALQAYSAAWHADNLVLHANPHRINAQQAESLLEEARLWLHILAQRFGLTPQKPIHIWLHADRQAQMKYTGAKHVDFAVGQHVHMTNGPLPHRTLGHELTHILVGQHAKTLWRIPGRWGVIPNMGLHEGLAVAATHELLIQHELTLWQQAAAMVQVDLAPALKQLFASGTWGFLQHTPAHSYALTGAALWFLFNQIEQKQGRHAVHKTAMRLIHSGSFEAAFANSQEMQAFHKQFLNKLRQTSLPQHALPWARQRFGGHSILQATCDPHRQKQIDHLMQQAHAGNWSAAHAAAVSARTLGHGESTGQLWLQLAQVASKQNNPQQGLHCLHQALKHLSPTQVALQTELFENIADALWQLGDKEAAIATYSAVDNRLLLPHEQRRLTIKQTLAAACVMQHCPQTITAALHLLTDKSEMSWATHSTAIASALAQESHRQPAVSNQPSMALSHYLLARYLLHSNATQQALWHLYEAASVTHRLPYTVRWELLALLAKAYTQLSAPHMAMQLYEHLQQHAPHQSQRVLATLELQRLHCRNDSDLQSLTRIPYHMTK